MFFILSKILSFLLSPFLWVIVCWVVYSLIKTAKIKKVFFWISLSLSLLFSNGYLAGKFVALWEISGKQESTIKTYDYGIVLSGMFEYNKDLDRLSARRGSDRLWQAIQLYHHGKIKKIILSGDSGYIFREGLHEANQLKNILIDQNIPADDILVENISRNTHENALETVHLLKKEKLMDKSFLLITSAIHMRRALGCFEKEGLKCTSFTTDHYHIISGGSFSVNSIFPSPDGFIMWQRIIKEWVGTFMYLISGYL
ncbi:MAG: YdcF family protein [Crocinitomicaceae bacterium]|jgi:uncharacterized SAM-binding protein YcdF (DUF218 family)|tara:strand:- start:1026 stop:1793 length:768 start_codon:yes stop_codon:yes gene_type:complete